MKIKGLDKFKNFSILFVPESGTGTRAYKFTFFKISLILTLFAAIVFIVTVFLVTATPFGNLFHSSENKMSAAEREQVDLLNEKVSFLVKEISKLKSTNEKLRYAIILGDSSLIDTTMQIDSSSSKAAERKKFGGNILEVFEFVLSRLFDEQPKHIYFFKPLNGFVSREFNPENGHFGIDFVAKTGAPVFASASGFVVFADFTTKDGYMIILSHTDNYITIYKHCSTLLKKERDIVFQGELIALSGNTGELSSGPHLHFEIWKNGLPLDPKKLIINY